jgi:hypothetical protein
MSYQGKMSESLPIEQLINALETSNASRELDANLALLHYGDRATIEYSSALSVRTGKLSIKSDGGCWIPAYALDYTYNEAHALRMLNDLFPEYNIEMGNTSRKSLNYSAQGRRVRADGRCWVILWRALDAESVFTVGAQTFALAICAATVKMVALTAKKNLSEPITTPKM